MRRYLINRWRLKAELGYEYAEGDVEWNPLNTVRYPCICFFAGFFAGMFGVGGGIVKGPLMLEMGERGQQTKRAFSSKFRAWSVLLGGSAPGPVRRPGPLPSKLGS